MAHFGLPAGATSVAVRHRTIDEIWYFVSGIGEMWLSADPATEVGVVAPIDVGAGTCISIPVGTHFQFRATSNVPLRAIGVTMPPWPGDGEAIRSTGPWTPTVVAGPGLADI